MPMLILSPCLSAKSSQGFDRFSWKLNPHRPLAVSFCISVIRKDTDIHWLTSFFLCMILWLSVFDNRFTVYNWVKNPGFDNWLWPHSCSRDSPRRWLLLFPLWPWNTFVGDSSINLKTSQFWSLEETPCNTSAQWFSWELSQIRAHRSGHPQHRWAALRALDGGQDLGCHCDGCSCCSGWGVNHGFSGGLDHIFGTMGENGGEKKMGRDWMSHFKGVCVSLSITMFNWNMSPLHFWWVDMTGHVEHLMKIHDHKPPSAGLVFNTHQMIR